MTIRQLQKISCVAGLACASAAFAQVPWVPSFGSGPFFTYTGGLSDNGLFGNPTLVGSQFQFFPSNFRAQSVNGVADSKTDRIEVNLFANAGHKFTQIKITEIGTWAITGIGSVQASGAMFLTDLNVPRSPAIASLATTPGMPISTPNSSGVWNGSVLIDLTSIIGPDWTALKLVFTNNLQATSNVGSSSYIEKKIVNGPSITIDVFPTPGSIAVLGLGGLVAFRRRRGV